LKSKLTNPVNSAVKLVTDPVPVKKAASKTPRRTPISTDRESPQSDRRNSIKNS